MVATKKKFKPGLLLRIVIALIAGVLIGLVAPRWVGHACATFAEVFGQLLSYLVPFIIIGFVTPAIADIGTKAGKLLVATAALAYVATLSSGFTSFIISDWLFPSLISAGAGADAAVDAEAAALSPGSPCPYLR